jgi:hypothetical protein
MQTSRSLEIKKATNHYHADIFLISFFSIILLLQVLTRLPTIEFFKKNFQKKANFFFRNNIPNRNTKNIWGVVNQLIHKQVWRSFFLSHMD